jgi:ornithine decarboxylase
MSLNPCGLSFHVGSQQRDIGQWDNAIAHCKYLFELCQKEKIYLSMINLGGGLPCNYLNSTLTLDTYCNEIKRFLKEDFGYNIPEIIMEPGRSLVGDSGTIVTEVILITQKNKLDLYKWVYVDIGLFGGLIETLGEAIKYPISCQRKGTLKEVILAGPTCDSMDILYQDFRYKLPASLKPGDTLFISSTGAYTTSYSSVGFNGFPPLKTVYINDNNN